MRRLLWIFLTWHVVWACAAETASAGEVRFNELIRPILTEHCLACHGPDPASRQADLRLDTGEGAMASGVIVAGHAEESELIARITSDDPDLQMSPPDHRKPLDAQQTELLIRWINEGAPWEKHWSFIPPLRPAPCPAGGHGEFLHGLVLAQISR